MKKKSIPLPCNEEQYMKVKFYCLKKNYKYIDLTNLLIDIIDKEQQQYDNEGNDKL